MNKMYAHNSARRNPMFYVSRFLLIMLLSFGFGKSWGQTSIPNTTAVTQNFDGMAGTTTLPSNWRIAASTASPVYSTASTTVTTAVSSGSPNTGATYNFGNSATTTDRSVGVISSGGFASPTSVIGYFRNTNASALTQLTVSYNAERYRINSAAASIQFFYSLNGSTWVAVTAGDIAAASFPTGTSVYNFNPSGTPSSTNTGVIAITGITITGLNIATSGDVYLRWNLNTTGSNSQAIAVDDISVTAAFAPPPPSVTLSVSSNTSSETSPTAITATATASAAVVGDQTVTLTVTGTNITTGDYTLNGGTSTTATITILNGQTTGTATFTVVDDAAIEGTETATFTISTPSSGITLGTPVSQNITITDNDFPTVNLSVSANSGTEAAQTAITVTATASQAVVGNQTVNLGVSGTNITGGDYTLSSATITILSGATIGTATFTVVDDAVGEGPETATLTISGPSSGITLGTTTTQNIAITDNDLITFYPITTSTDLALLNNWTTDVNGGAGTAPVNFTSATQLFNINRSAPLVGSLTFSGGSNLEINGATLTINSAAILSIGTGSTGDFKGQPVVIKSISAGTGSIGQISGTLSNASAVTVERYIPAAGFRAFRLLGSSVNTAGGSKPFIRDNWQEGTNNTDLVTNNDPVPTYGTHITGSTIGANGFDATQNGNPSMYFYQYGTPDTYQPLTTTLGSFDASIGYLIFMRGDRTFTNITTTTGSTNTTLRTTGTLITGNVPVTLQANSRFTLVTNPYASAINWATIYADGTTTALENFYTYLEPRIGSRGGYVTVTNTGTTSAATNATVNIPSGQAFFVKSLGAGTPALTIKETHKSSDNSRQVFRTGSQEAFSVSLYFNLAGGVRRIADGVNVLYNNNYSAAVDGNDAEQIANFDEDLAIKRDGKLLSIEGRPLVDQNDTIFLNIAKLLQKGYELEFAPTSFNAPGLQAFLQDNFLNTEIPVSLTQATVVPFTVTANAASAAADRFRVVFRNLTVLPINFTLVKAFEKGTTVQVEWNLGNESSLKQYEIEKSTDGRTFSRVGTQAKRSQLSIENYAWLDALPNSGNNYYRIKAIEQNGQFKYSQVVSVKTGKGNSSITVYPNPVSGGVINVQFVNQPKGMYNITLFNAAGQQVYGSQFSHAGGSATEPLQINSKLAKGTYQLQINNGDSKVSQKVLVQQP